MTRLLISVGARERPHRVLPLFLLLTLPLAICSGAAGQNPNPSDEVRGHSTAPPFQLHTERNLVDVRVVVRDPNGKAIGNLHREDFRLLDNGKPQEVSGFAVEVASSNAATNQAPAPQTGGTNPTIAVAPLAAPQRFVGLYFDDYHLTPEGIARTRKAAWDYVTTSVRPQDRVAILTATGKDQLEFTGDREELHEALNRIAPRPRSSSGCPEIEDYEAYLAVKLMAPDALAVLHGDATECTCGDRQEYDRPVTMLPPPTGQRTSQGILSGSAPVDPCDYGAMKMSEAAAAEVWSEAEMESQYALTGIEFSVRRMAAMPGQRTLVLVSPGFLTETLHEKIDAIVGWALHQDVVVSAVDAAGLYAYEPYRNALNITAMPDPRRERLERNGLVISRDVLASLADRTGGTFFHNSNDFDDGFRQTAAVPEIYYVLSFSPTDFKPDGKFHSLKVSLKSPGQFAVEARRGYFATETAQAGVTPSQTELEKVVFSQDEVRALPVDITTKVQKLADQKTKLTVNIHVDLRSLQFRKDGDRSVNTLIFDTALFDNDGKYVTGKEGSLELHLKDATLQRILQTGINADTSFEVAAGTYRIREVVRDTESKQITSLNYVTQVSD